MSIENMPGPQMVPTQDEAGPQPVTAPVRTLTEEHLAQGGQPGEIAGWGRVFFPGRMIEATDLEEASRGAVLMRGLGRSYGDSAVPPASRPVVVATPLANNLRRFDRETGILRAEAGLSLMELNRLFLHEGWFVPVTPGTQFVTLGGMVAADVHGKNHHVAGCFGEHVTALRLRVADGRIVECSPEAEPELFWATIGGMGLTGHILEVEFAMKRVPSPWIVQETRQIPNIEAFVRGLKDAAARWPMTVGWVDCLSRGEAMGRGILIAGRWAEAREAPRRRPRWKNGPSVPFVFPQFALNPLTVKTFNAAYYAKHGPRLRRAIVDPQTFFYPLDAVREWNRIYGPRGFTQYQCVIPEDGSCKVSREFFDVLTRLGGASFLCVIKDCGPQGKGLLSFPMPGISIALDVPVRDNTQRIVDELNAFVIGVGGRIYLAKDTFSRAEDFRAMEPRLEAFQAVRRAWDPECRIKSAQSVRLMGDPA
jgi:decaprenylphospho-beta-D-ribofuranose 2-oxidase